MTFIGVICFIFAVSYLLSTIYTYFFKEVYEIEAEMHGVTPNHHQAIVLKGTISIALFAAGFFAFNYNKYDSFEECMTKEMKGQPGDNLLNVASYCHDLVPKRTKR